MKKKTHLRCFKSKNNLIVKKKKSKNNLFQNLLIPKIKAKFSFQKTLRKEKKL